MPEFSSPISPNEQRDHLANVRTVLAWIRTSVTIMALGFVVAKFGIVLDEMPRRQTRILDLHLAAVIGTALVTAGALVLVLAMVEFIAVGRAIHEGTVYFRWLVPIGLCVLLIGVGVVLAVYLILTS